MATRPLTVELPEAVFQQLIEIAQLTNSSPEEIAAQRIAINLPPSVSNAPPEIQSALLKMQTLPIEELLNIAHSKIPLPEQQSYLELLDKNQTGIITASESEALKIMRLAADQLMLQKAYAWAVLKWRGYPIPKLEELPEE